jgi:hypothetical protein
MASTSVAQLFVLGDLAAAHGKLGAAHSKATSSQMTVATDIVTNPSSYGRVGTTVVCVEDRLHRPDPRLAGGGLSLGLMYNFLYGGALLSANFRELKALSIRLALHRDCGALNLVANGFIQRELSNVNAEGYTLLAAMGVDVPANVRRRIVVWAKNLPAGYVDMDTVMQTVDEIDDIQGEHNAIFAAISEEDGVSFIGGPRLETATNGLLSFAFDPWAAHRAAQRIGVARDDQAAAEALALVFTAQVFLTLGGPDLKVALHR